MNVILSPWFFMIFLTRDSSLIMSPIFRKKLRRILEKTFLFYFCGTAEATYRFFGFLWRLFFFYKNDYSSGVLLFAWVLDGITCFASEADYREVCVKTY